MGVSSNVLFKQCILKKVFNKEQLLIISER